MLEMKGEDVWHSEIALMLAQLNRRCTAKTYTPALTVGVLQPS